MNNLKPFMELFGIQQKELADYFGIAKSTISQYANGIHEPRSEFWEALSKKYKVSVEYLMGFTNDPKGSGFVNDLQLTYEEKRLLMAWRMSDKRAKEDVEHALRNYLARYDMKIRKDEKE